MGLLVRHRGGFAQRERWICARSWSINASAQKLETSRIEVEGKARWCPSWGSTSLWFWTPGCPGAQLKAGEPICLAHAARPCIGFTSAHAVATEQIAMRFNPGCNAGAACVHDRVQHFAEQLQVKVNKLGCRRRARVGAVPVPMAPFDSIGAWCTSVSIIDYVVAHEVGPSARNESQPPILGCGALGHARICGHAQSNSNTSRFQTDSALGAKTPYAVLYLGRDSTRRSAKGGSRCAMASPLRRWFGADQGRLNNTDSNSAALWARPGKPGGCPRSGVVVGQPIDPRAYTPHKGPVPCDGQDQGVSGQYGQSLPVRPETTPAGQPASGSLLITLMLVEMRGSSMSPEISVWSDSSNREMCSGECP